MTSRRAQILVPLFVILASAAVYLPSLTYGFVYDDPRQIEMAAPRYTWAYVPSYFTSDVWGFVQQEKSNYYRPVFLIWLLLNYQAFGNEPWPWHLTTIGMHLAAVLLLYFLALRLTRDRMTAAIAALIFGLHPSHAEAVAWISGVTEPLLAVLSFGAILCHLRARDAVDPAAGRRWRAASLALFALDIFQKETALVLPVLLFADWWINPDRESRKLRDRFRMAVLGLLPYLYTSVFYLGMRVMALGGFTPHRSIWSWKMMLWTVPSVAWFYLRGLLWPTGFSLFYDVTAVTHPSWGNFVLPLVPVIFAVALLLWIASRSRAGAFAALLLVVPLLPVLYVRAFSPVDLVHNRYLYVPSAGLALLAALGLRRVSERSQAAALAGAAVVAAILAVATLRESRPWKDDLTLSAHALQVAPQSSIAQSFYGGSLYLAGRFSEALPYLESSVTGAENEDRHEALYTVGLCLMRMDAWSAAAADFARVVELRPDFAQAHLMLGLAEEQLGNPADAELQMRDALRLRPRVTIQYQGYHYYLGAVLEKKGDLKDALAEYQAEFEENPDMDGLPERIAKLRGVLSAP